jgi:hypothetical protein
LHTAPAAKGDVERDQGSEALPTLRAVSDSLQPDTPLTETGMPTEGGSPPASVGGGDTEEVDALVVAPAARALSERRDSRTVVPAVQAAAVAAGSFVAGAAMVGLAHRRQRRRELVRVGGRRGLGRGGGRRGASGGRGSRGMGELVQIVGSRSLLVDVHLLGGRD